MERFLALLLLCVAGCSLAAESCWNTSIDLSIEQLNPTAQKNNAELNAETILTGHIYQVGDFNECLYDLDAKYCLTFVKILPVNNTSQFWLRIQEKLKYKTNYPRDLITVGLCVPKICDYTEVSRDFENYMNRVTAKYGVKVRVELESKNCQTKENVNAPITTREYIAALVIVSILLMVLTGSLYESVRIISSYEKPPNTFMGKFMICFSIINNWKRLTTLSETEESKQFRSIQGIRTVSMYLVVASHTMYRFIVSFLKNPEFYEDEFKNFGSSGLINGQTTMGTFLSISGFLTTYFFYKEAKQKNSVSFTNIIKAVVHRYIRLTPVYAIVILLQASWLDRFGSGPTWNIHFHNENENCRHYWWTNLLYMNNFIHSDNLCLKHTWYLATDFQNFIIALVVLKYMWQYPKFAKWIMGGLLSIWIVIPTVQTYMEELDPVLMNYPEYLRVFPKEKTFLRRYITLQGNAGSYTVGIIFGYMYFHARENGFKFSKIHYILAWSIIAFLPWTMLSMGYVFYQPSYVYDPLFAGIYAGLNKVIFSFGICTLITTFAMGYGSVPASAASWKPIQYLGRLSYTVYIGHAPFLMMSAGAQKNLIYITKFLILKEWFAYFVLSTLYALALTICIELPISALSKILFMHSGNEKKEELYKTTTNMQVMDTNTTNNKLLEEAAI